VPAGVNLAWVASIPAVAIAFAPLTLLAGPVVSYNTAMLLMPALAAWSAFLLCRAVTARIWPSLAGGYLFGFSSYVLGHEQGHLHLTAVFPLPLIALATLRFARGELGGRGFALRLGVLLAVVAGASTELLLTSTLALAAGIALAAATGLLRDPRRVATGVLGGCVVAAILAAPLLYYALSDFHGESFNKPEGWGTDVANFVVPTRLTALGVDWTRTVAARFPGNDAERSAYLGLPLLVIIGWFALLEWRRRRGRFLLGAAALAAVCALGTTLVVAGHRVVTLPWSWVARLPAFDNVLPARLLVFVALAVAVMAAIWLASQRVPRTVRVAGAVLAIGVLVPNVRLANWHTTPRLPRFVTHHLYRSCLSPSNNVVVLPYEGNGDSMLWQAESGFAFRQAGGYVRPRPPESFLRFAAVRSLYENQVPPGGIGAVQRFVRATGVDAILVDEARSRPWGGLLRPLAQPRAVGGVLLYRVGGSAWPAGCGRNPVR
jgi:hypothetical protein